MKKVILQRTLSIFLLVLLFFTTLSSSCFASKNYREDYNSAIKEVEAEKVSLKFDRPSFSSKSVRESLIFCDEETICVFTFMYRILMDLRGYRLEKMHVDEYCKSDLKFVIRSFYEDEEFQKVVLKNQSYTKEDITDFFLDLLELNSMSRQNINIYNK